jgi:hypothetical protein
MSKLPTIAAAAVLSLHGVIHLMGTAAYLRLAEVRGLPYRTTLLGGRWEPGDGGMRVVVGVLWTVAAVGFVAAAVAWLTGWEAWRQALAAVALLSLSLTALDWSRAYVGVVVNLAVLAVLWLGPRVSAALAG